MRLELLHAIDKTENDDNIAHLACMVLGILQFCEVLHWLHITVKSQ